MKIRKIFWHVISFKYFFKFKHFGMMSYISKPMIIDINHGNVSIGEKFRVQPGMRMELLNKYSNINIGKNVSIGQNLHIISSGNLIIGDNVTISGNVFITNVDHDYREIGKNILNQKYLIKETVIGDNCFIGYGAVIQAGTKLGKQCVVGSNAVVRGVYPDYCVIAGVPAKIIKRYSLKNKKWIRT